MQPQIPMPTDNLYKFIALFGFALVMSSLLGTVYVSTSTNSNILTYVSEMENIENKGKEEESSKYKVYGKLIGIAAENRKSFHIGFGTVIGVGLWLMFFGFKRWYSYYQPLYDELLELNVAKLKNEMCIQIESVKQKNEDTNTKIEMRQK